MGQKAEQLVAELILRKIRVIGKILVLQSLVIKTVVKTNYHKIKKLSLRQLS
ncbi:hypothetical protein SBF1_7410003 [Candidatus Desulfosporosinus infrequens]|uniref:Uncharacterized protein n=1 Tax=Candidatus Desulfosporosinus infrequens TaxID=2043169 RepID=A0A2U3LQZ8_9FIRM|nr:hypothetical protein SBF1_7410003 [Candidatus Desulfosporosinus infrequens]